MADVGRNDPCPCGSGKKYKHCHWRIDQEVQRQNVQLDRAWRTLSQRVQEFGVQPSMAPEYVSAWERFWDKKVPVQAVDTLNVVQRFRFIDWYIYDYRTSRDRKRVAELFLEAHGSELSSLEQDLMGDWVTTHLSVYEVLDASEDHVDVRDVFTAEEQEVSEAGMDEYPIIGTRLMARLLPLGGSLRIAPGATPLPPSDGEGLLEFIQPRFKAWQEARYGADWDDFLGEAGYLLNHFMIRDMEPMEVPATEEAEMEPHQAARSIAHRMQRELITSSLAAHYDRWLGKSIPEWGGKTPREMVRTPEGAEKVEFFLELLEDIEEERGGSGQPTYDVSLLRRKLGLTTEARTEGGIILPG